MILAQTRSAIIGFFFGLALVLYFSKRLGLIASPWNRSSSSDFTD